ncbi:MAG TPA: phosphomannomutase/phosphoglucomutase [Acidimicrobiales bacterium]|nr:phosphomannomutase/phosphoglucomutase [Acidimicrobiales bacterium]
MTALDAVFKAYDVRGTVPEQLDGRACHAIGWAFARFAGTDRVLVARDMRESGIELSAAFTAGARTAGATVVDLGLASTDMMYFASGLLDAPGAMFTASHNPAAYNGIKMCVAGARPIGQDTGLADIRDEAQAAIGSNLDEGAETGGYERRELLDEYAEHVRSFVDTSALRPLKVVADTANGMGGLVVPKAFEGLPVDLEILFPELDGTFPNHPADPIQDENLRDLKDAVLRTGADVGLAFDGDADRVFLVDEKAEPVSGSLTTALVARAMLAKHPGSTVLYNLICSKVVPETIEQYGGTPVRTRVGHSFIKQVMAETGAVFGGEHSGHYYFRDNYRADSGLIAALVILEELSAADMPLSQFLAPYRRYADSGEINTKVDDPTGAVEALARHFAAEGREGDRTDGLTVEFDDWWFNVRPSNTEPLLRLNVEAKSPEECDHHTTELLDLVARLAGTAAAAEPH